MDAFDEIAQDLRGSYEWDEQGLGLRATPAALSLVLRETLRDAALVEVAVTGVASGIRRRQRMVGFELTESLPGESSPLAVIPVVAFGWALDSARRVTDGATVEVAGCLEWKPEWGQLRIVAESVTVLARTSAQVERRECLVRTLTVEGLLARQAGLTVPSRPRRVGLVSSRGSAGDADVRALLETADVDLVAQSAPMSGPRAAHEVAAVLDDLTRTQHLDVVVVARGGGARSDLDWADNETLARAIATCSVPVWTALGHATDSTVADLVANRACITPTAAAAAVVERLTAADHAHAMATAGLAPARTVPARVDWASRRRQLVVAVVVLVVVLWLLSGGR